MDGTNDELRALMAVPYRVLGSTPKLAYMALWWECGGRPGTLPIRLCWLQEHVGVTSGGATKWLKDLRELGVIDTADDERPGWIRVTVYRPTIDPRWGTWLGQKRPPDPQRELFDKRSPAVENVSIVDADPDVHPDQRPDQRSGNENSDVHPDVHPDEGLRVEPAATPEPAGSTAQTSLKKAFMERMEALGARGPPGPANGPSGCADIKDLNPKSLNRDLDLGAKHVGGFSTEDLTTEGIVAAIHKRLGDPNLHAGPAWQVAEALVDGTIEWKDVVRAIQNARRVAKDDKDLQPWMYFVGAMKKHFHERGLVWQRKRRRRRSDGVTG